MYIYILMTCSFLLYYFLVLMTNLERVAGRGLVVLGYENPSLTRNL